MGRWGCNNCRPTVGVERKRRLGRPADQRSLQRSTAQMAQKDRQMDWRYPEFVVGNTAADSD